MADTTYTDNVTVITADTMNDLNRLHYTILGDPATGAAAANTLITGLTADATPDITADYVATADADAATGKKVLVKNLFAGSTALGIGTASPSYALHVAAGAGNQTAAIINTAGGASDTATLYTASGATSAQTSSYGNGDAYFIASASGSLVIGNSSSGPVLLFQNNTDRGRIDANGYFLIGYTSSNGTFPLQVNGQIFATSSTVATSDGKYKQQVQELTNALGIISALRPVTFRWKNHPIHNFDDGEQVGFIAQEVQSALAGKGFNAALVKNSRATVPPGGKGKGNVTLPNGVDEEFLGIAEGKMIPLLVAALKELKAEFDAYVAAHP